VDGKFDLEMSEIIVLYQEGFSQPMLMLDQIKDYEVSLSVIKKSDYNLYDE
jgi:hypothetical protein